MPSSRVELPAFRQALRELVRALDAEQGVTGCCGGLRFAQCHALLAIDETGQATLVDLANTLNLDKSTLSRTAQSLVKLGLVERREDARDRRLRPLFLTPAGRRSIRAINAQADRRFGAALASIPAAQRAPLFRQLQRLVRALRESKVP